MTRPSATRLATSLFEKSFASRPIVGASAPGRVNLIGEHTDYNGGPVLPLALERRTAVVAGPGTGWWAVSAIDGVVKAFDPWASSASSDWTTYLAGVIRVLGRLGNAPRGAMIAVASTVPIGAGLASSASLSVAATLSLGLLAGVRLTPRQLADCAFQAEHDEVGVRCGRMDQTVVAMATPGHALLIETATGEIQRVPFRGKVWVVETGVSHRLSGGTLNQRRRECEEALALCRESGWPIDSLAHLPVEDLERVSRVLPPPLVPRVRHVVRETARARAAAQALAQGDLEKLGRYLTEGHWSLRDDYQSSCSEADLIVSAAMRRGAFGARLTGAGWGGAVVLLTPAAHEARITAEIQEDCRLALGRRPVIWASRAAGGAKAQRVLPK